MLKHEVTQNENALGDERAILGAMLLSSECVAIAFGNVPIWHFQDVRHELIYEAMRKVAASGAPIDTVTVRERLNREKKLDDAGGDEYLLGLMEIIPSAQRVRDAAQSVHKAHQDAAAQDAELQRMLSEMEQARGEVMDAAGIIYAPERCRAAAVAAPGGCKGVVGIAIDDRCFIALTPEQAAEMSYALSSLAEEAHEARVSTKPHQCRRCHSVCDGVCLRCYPYLSRIEAMKKEVRLEIREATESGDEKRWIELSCLWDTITRSVGHMVERLGPVRAPRSQ